MADYTSPFSSLFSSAANANGIDPNTLNTFAWIESGGRPDAQTGSYRGLFQLSPAEFNKYGGGNIFDPTDNTNAAARKLAAETQSFQSTYGRAPTPADLYMVHQQGEGSRSQSRCACLAEYV
jgi:soluble lytic murein transglycosylase-like protein